MVIEGTRCHENSGLHRVGVLVVLLVWAVAEFLPRAKL